MTGTHKSKFEVADIFREHIRDYLKVYKMSPAQFEVVSDIIGCRTEWLGGHIQKCSNCEKEIPLYNSCRNRHCPKCQSMAKERWLVKRKSEVLPVKYFHNVFTVPHELNPIILSNKKVAINILFRSVSETLLQFGANPDNGLGGKLGFMAFLHSWNQPILDHFHIHIIVPAGALSADGEKWIPCECDWLFPERALSKVFRGKFMFHLNKAYAKKELIFPGNTAKYGTSNGFRQLKNNLRSKTWVVDVAPPPRQPMQKGVPEKNPEEPRRPRRAGIRGGQKRQGDHDGAHRIGHNEVPFLQKRRSDPRPISSPTLRNQSVRNHPRRDAARLNPARMKFDDKTKADLQKKSSIGEQQDSCVRNPEIEKKDKKNNDLERSSMEIRTGFRQNINKTGKAWPLRPASFLDSRLKKAFTIPIYIWYPILKTDVMRFSSTSFYPASR